MGATLQQVFALAILLLFVGASWFWFAPWARGARGERRVHSKLRSLSAHGEYRIISDVILPTQSDTTQIDHIVISHCGVFVIETKNMSGWIFGAYDQSRWTQVFFRKKFQFQNPTHQNYKHVKAVQEVLGLKADAVIGIVAFVGSAVPKTAMPSEVVWSLDSLIDRIRSKRVVVFHGGEIDRLENLLRMKSLPRDGKTRGNHVKQLKARIARRQDPTACPRCGSALVQRSNKKSGELFLGCSRYPSCSGTRRLD